MLLALYNAIDDKLNTVIPIIVNLSDLSIIAITIIKTSISADKRAPMKCVLQLIGSIALSSFLISRPPYVVLITILYIYINTNKEYVNYILQ